ncbi:hypothetical protein [Burkholderia pyrrocinia]|uniref:hypothetical protein n=1 Tax=Burkholderia pyrrocinia TaxID=60550 RepID=UPI00158EB7A1|nr:hypothetical protein [Burkholderia pyrrocinia]
MVFKAFSDDTTVVNINGDALTVTNDTDRVVVSGELEITRDKAGLHAALALQQAITSIVEALQRDPALPERIADDPPTPTGTVKNPF